MQEVGVNQQCICSLGLAPECPAHPFRVRRQRKRKSGAVRHAACAACVALGEKRHGRGGRHTLAEYGEVAAALSVGTVFCTLPQLDKKATLVVRSARRHDDGGLELEVLEGWFRSSGKVWAEPVRRVA